MKLIYATLVDIGCDINSQVVSFPYPDEGKTVAAGLRELAPHGANIVAFVHRDADNAGREARVAEINTGAEESGFAGRVIPVIPVKETEAWLLYALGSEQFRDDLGLTMSPAVESILVPRKNCEAVEAKGRLRALHDAVRAAEGRKASDAAKFERVRSLWLSRITSIDLLQGCDSFEAFRQDCRDVLFPQN